MKFTVAIDGPAASGKGTIARAVAREFSFQHLDTGLLYRAVGAKAATGIDPEEAARTLSPADLEKPGLRSEAAGQAASKVAAIAEVRAHLLTFQQDFAVLPDGAILDGRDIGTVVCPDAEVKIFVTASDEVRAHRRWKEEGETGSLDAILADVRARDARDRERATSPLRPADDAIVLDTSHLSIETAVSQAIELVRDRLNG